MDKNKTMIEKIKKSLNEIEEHLASDDDKEVETKDVISKLAEKSHDIIDKAEAGASNLSEKIKEKTESFNSLEDKDKKKSMCKYISAAVVAIIAILSFKKLRNK